MRALALRVNQAGVKITTYNLSKDFLFPPRLCVSARALAVPVCAQYKKIACEAVKRMLLVIENATTSAQRLVQSAILGRAPSKII
jgi:hypothetical protein